MQRLNRGMLSRYDIPIRRPRAVRAVQFGADPALLGIVDRLIGAGNPSIGIACALPPCDTASLLDEQDGLYTLLVRGYRNETPVKEEFVPQCLTRVVLGDAALEALALEPGLKLALVNTLSPSLSVELTQAARLLRLRREAGFGGLAFICLGERADCAVAARDAVAALGSGDFGRWLREACDFHPALAEGFVRRADADEAARQCAEMNYADALLHIAEPFARLTVQAPQALGEALGLDDAWDIVFTDDISPALERKHRLFDAGLFAMAAPGWLLGLDTLSDCMKHERLRAFVGRAYYDELLGGERAADAPYVVEAFERFENPLNRNDILRSASFLLSRFAIGALPIMRRIAAEEFEPPRRLSFALAATIMLYAGARPGPGGRWEVARGSETQALQDDDESLRVFATLSHDMPPEALAYAALADRELWHGADLREIEGLEARVALDIANIQRDPRYLPE